MQLTPRILILILLVVDGFAFAATPSSRQALLIGNANYDAPLLNPANDARAMAARLQQLGFDVTLQINLNRSQMLKQVADFASRARNADTALVFYAGHGAQGGDSNYLIPVDLPTRNLSQSLLQRGGYDVNLLMGELQRQNVKAGVLLIDACRVVYQRGAAPDSQLQGLAKQQPPKGYLLAYSTSPGGRASDYWSTEVKNSPYTYTLLQELATPGQPLESMLKKVSTRVADLTGHTQIPWYSSNLTGGALVLNPSSKQTIAAAPSARIGGSRGAPLWEQSKLYDWAIEIRQQKQDPYLDRPALKQRASQGDVVAQTGWAMLNQTDAERKRWLQRAADQSFPIAQMYLGEWYLDNERPPKGRREAERWLNQAAQYFPPAAATLANLQLQSAQPDDVNAGLQNLLRAAQGQINYARSKSPQPTIAPIWPQTK